MTMIFDRRQILLAGAAGTTLALPGCQTMPGFSLTEAIRRLLTLASQNAFALLLQPGGFYDSSVARIALPERFGGNSGVNIVSLVLQSRSFRDRLQRQLNRAAEKGAERAAPIVADAVRAVSIEAQARLCAAAHKPQRSFCAAKWVSRCSIPCCPGSRTACGCLMTRLSTKRCNRSRVLTWRLWGRTSPAKPTMRSGLRLDWRKATSAPIRKQPMILC